MSEENFQGKNITNLVNNLKKRSVKILKRDSRGGFGQFKEVAPGNSKGPLNHIDITDLRFVVEDPPADGVYFGIVKGVHTSGPKPHIDGQVGHPDEFGNG